MSRRRGSRCHRLIVLLIVASALPACSGGAASAPDPAATPTAPTAIVITTLPRVSPTPTAVPDTPTPWPTATPAPPTPTAEDLSPTASPAPTAELTDADRAYLARRMHPLFFTVQGLVGLSVQAGLAAGDASLLRDDDWRSQTETFITMLRTSSQQLQEPRAVPPDFQGLEQDLATLSKEGAAVATAYGDGVDHRDAQELAQSKPDLDQALAQIKRIEAELKAASAKYDENIVASH
jgi:hypothetical protein